MKYLAALLLSTLPLLASPNTMQGVQFCPLRLNAKENLENLLLWSEDFTQADWTTFNGASKVGVAAGVGPNGENAMEVSFGAGLNSAFYEVLPNNPLSTQDYIQSWFVRAVSGTTTIRIESNNDYSGDISIGTSWTWISNATTVSGLRASLRNNSSDNSANIYVLRVHFHRASTSSTYVKTTAVPYTTPDGTSVQAWYDPNSPLNTLNGAGMSQLKNLAPDALENWLLWSEDFTKADWVEYNGTTKVGVASGVGPNGEDAMEVNFGATGGPTAGAIYQIVYPSQASTQYWLVRAKTGTTTVRLGWWDGSDPAVFLTADLPLTTSWVVLSQDISATLGASSNLSIRNNVAGDSGNVYVLRAQLRRATKSPTYVKTEAIRYVVEDRDLNQSTGASQPLLADMANGTKCLLFDGTDDYMKTATFPLVQPTTVVGVFEQVTWTYNDYIFDGFTAASGIFWELGTTPTVTLYAGGVGPSSSDFSVGSFSAVSTLFNGASSTLSINSLTPSTGNVGTDNMNGFTLGSNGAGGAGFSNIKSADLLILNRVLTSAEQSYLVQGLARKAGVNVW